MGGASRGRAQALGAESRLAWALGAWLLRPCASCPPAAAEAGLQQRRVFALHLRRYNDALLIHDTVRAVDALAVLRDFYDRERTTKTQILRAERWLLALFDGEARWEEGDRNGTRCQRPARARTPSWVGKVPTRALEPYFYNQNAKLWI